jgi:hypothetical protein
VWPLLCAMQLVNSLVFVYDGLIFATQRWSYVRNVMLVACLGKLSLNQPCDSPFRRFLYLFLSLYFIWMLCVVHLRRCLRADFGFWLRCSTVSLISAITFFSFFLFFSAVYFESIFSLLLPTVPCSLSLSLSLSLSSGTVHGAADVSRRCCGCGSRNARCKECDLSGMAACSTARRLRAAGTPRQVELLKVNLRFEY